ncbi:unnamed protein product [Adineta steineri]|uniref:Uncharacterized protein n=1 Tax=Adineta steineri TaxID=433720 RepID=A0A814U526_9BILA|nr:unnamed protein product [Adineta steineri]CAF1290665.1 unnamed protein product [Adineta steineri]CAF3688575.1 unnamed protein product [Adineta steineri]CAF3708305.1 unnamed protein product [Adineta steineri]
MSINSKQDSSNNNNNNEINSPNNENSSPEISDIQKEENQVNSSTTLELNRTNSQLSSEKFTQQNSRRNTQISSPKMTRSQSDSSNLSEQPDVPPPKNTNENLIQRPISPTNGHRDSKQRTPASLVNRQRARSNSPRKTFSYLPPDRLNIRKWKQQQRLITKQDENNRIYYENRQKLERLAKIAREASSYPTTHIEQERLRERHAHDHRRKVLKSYIPILQNNLCIVDRLANVKGVYDVKKMEEDFNRHTNILKQDAANRKKARETAAQRPFILPKINLKS